MNGRFFERGGAVHRVAPPAQPDPTLAERDESNEERGERVPVEAPEAAPEPRPTPLSDVDQFEFTDEVENGRPASDVVGRGQPEQAVVLNATGDDGRDDPPPDPAPQEDADPDPAPPPIDLPDEVAGPTEQGRPVGTIPGVPEDTIPAPAPGLDNAEYGRAPDAAPDPNVPVLLTSYTSGGDAATSYNVTIDFVGSWTVELQQAFVDAADYLSTIILADLPDAIVDGVFVDDIAITATLETNDGVGGTLGSAGPRELRDDGTLLPSTGAMTFDIADAGNLLSEGNWDAVVVHEMLHALGYGTLWGLLGLTTGSIAGGDLRFIGPNALSVYETEFPDVAAGDPGSNAGIPIETDFGPGTAGGHWDEALFENELMTGFIDDGAFLSVMSIASLEDLGYDTVFDNPGDPNDLSAPIPPDPVLDLMA
ncbi:hypothetical protein KUV51_11825 [Tateyamaria omphalii]|uniref:leishmanolysin-related zinc metalloendopeptidase n=1 Tax=Tateyamaria omphalii TaxID=299262 RepID=UPI001C992925|nr:leishmanolysin-related zinc metalloendopeptidase [Tateyamaria omphalii]MBY5933691.1 hypothetical protein [Tateyamaria omphalii]